jgi:hypothetical protein
MALKIGDTAPDFEAETTEGRLRFHDWIGDSWALLFSHPRDFTPVCTTELGYLAKIKPEFDRREVKIIGLSVDPVANHEKWAGDIAETQGHAPNSRTSSSPGRYPTTKPERSGPKDGTRHAHTSASSPSRDRTRVQELLGDELGSSASETA